MLCLHLEAPFAVFRPFMAGSFRPTAGFITPSAAYGLLLNVAGIEMRRVDPKRPMTLIRSDLPRFRLALGAIAFPQQHSLYQQLHNYPVGSSAKEHAASTKGTKYNIAPARRSVLSDLNACLCMNGNPDMEAWVGEGLKGKRPRRYGLPFLGDNNFLIDRLEPVTPVPEAYWFKPIPPDEDEGLREHVTRLTLRIDRADMSRTESALFAPEPESSPAIPEEAWVEVGY